MIQYYSVKVNTPQTSLARESRVETVSKQLEYVTKGHTAKLNLKRLYSLAP